MTKSEEILGIEIKGMDVRKVNSELVRKILQDFFDVCQIARENRRPIQHSSYYAKAEDLATHMGDMPKKHYFKSLYDWAISVESDREIADYMMDSMWGVK